VRVAADVDHLGGGCGAEHTLSDADSAEVGIGHQQDVRRRLREPADERERVVTGDARGVDDAEVVPLVGERLGRLQVLDDHHLAGLVSDSARPAWSAAWPPLAAPVLGGKMRGMETTRDVRDREAYIPPDADPSRDRYWPPADRAMAIEWAREHRLREGLELDDAPLERVADAVMEKLAGPQGRRLRRQGRAPHRLYYTPEERDDDRRWQESRGGVPHGLYDAVKKYLDRHPEINGGVDHGWHDGRRVLFVGIVGDAQPHRAALNRIGGDRVVLERRPHRVSELSAIEDRIRADEPELTAAGLRLEYVWFGREGGGVVYVGVIGGSDERAIAEFFAARYGEAVVAVWLGPNSHKEVAHAFGSWTAEGRRIRVFYGLDFNGQLHGQARVEQETDGQIVIALSRLEPVGAKTLIGGFSKHQADVELREPAGDRAVIDASAGVARPSVVQLRSRPDRHWPYPAGPDRPPGRAVEPTDVMIEEVLEEPLSSCAYLVLKRSGVEFVEDVAWLSAEELAALPDMSQKVLDEIVDILAARGLSLSAVAKR
jgi:Bacterial RNA polymerase, alpha chain C terminal domain